jgi:MGT family glycosyltransferase
MPKAIFFNVPAHGHINPSLPLVAKLIQCGHEIIYFTTETYRQRVAATGTSVQIYAGIEDDYFGVRGLDGSIPQLAAQTLLITTKSVLPGLLEWVKKTRPDYILYDCMCPWGYYVAQIMKLPSVSSSSLMPLSPRVMLNWQAMRLFLPMLAQGFRAGNEANRLSRAVGNEYNVKPLGLTNVLNAPADLIISYSSAAYVPFANTLPKNVRLIGWTMQENVTDEPFVHNAERPLIYVSLGTVSNQNTAFFQMCIAALAELSCTVLISTGGRLAPEHFGTLPEKITIQSWVPQSQVLRRAALFVTHGGLNSIHDGLYCGLPMLLVPQQTEQTFNAMRVVELGAGLMLKKDELNESTIKTSVEKLLSDPRYKINTSRIGESLRLAGGVDKAVAEIEALLRNTSTSSVNRVL